MTPIIDSHLDLSWNALSWGRDLTLPLDRINELERHMTDERARGRATTCLPEMRRAGIGVCLATILVRAPRNHQPPPGGYLRTKLDHPAPQIAWAIARGQLAYYHSLEVSGHLRWIRTASDLRAHWSDWNRRPDQAPLGVILAMEGADPILSPADLETWWNDGLRSLGLVHYGHGQYGAGTGAEGPLTPQGVELLREMQRVCMILDATHLADESFFEALDRYDGPVLASHNNCRALVPGQRQFSDEQLRLLIQRGAVIGAAFDAWMMYPGWEIGRTNREVVHISAAADHIDHICQLAGNADHVAIGSDLDGGFGSEQTPVGLDSIADLQKIAGILASRGYDRPSVDAIFHGNWLRFFTQHLPAVARAS
jgi:membrane dipeptidase